MPEMIGAWTGTTFDLAIYLPKMTECPYSQAWCMVSVHLISVWSEVNSCQR